MYVYESRYSRMAYPDRQPLTDLFALIEAVSTVPIAITVVAQDETLQVIPTGVIEVGVTV